MVRTKDRLTPGFGSTRIQKVFKVFENSSRSIVALGEGVLIKRFSERMLKREPLNKKRELEVGSLQKLLNDTVYHWPINAQKNISLVRSVIERR